MSLGVDLWIKSFQFQVTCCRNLIFLFCSLYLPFLCNSGPKAVVILEAYEGTLEDDYPPDNERCEHGEMLLYKVSNSIKP